MGVVGAEMGEIAVRRIDEYEAVIELGTAAGLNPEERGGSEVLAMWGAFEGERLVGSITLEQTEGLHVVNWLAVADGFRGRGVGGRLLATVESEAAQRGSTRLWATARAPGFFVRHGYLFVDAGPNWELLLADCPRCPQFRSRCFPRAVTKAIAEAR